MTINSTSSPLALNTPQSLAAKSGKCGDREAGVGDANFGAAVLARRPVKKDSSVQPRTRQK